MCTENKHPWEFRSFRLDPQSRNGPKTYSFLSSPPMSCPVDHSAHSNPPSDSGSCPVDHKSLSQHSSPSLQDKCPVDHQSASSLWSRFFSSSSEGIGSSPSLNPHPHVPQNLSTEREHSSIPRLEGDKWVYPSESQFFAAMARKNHDPQAKDMKVIVPMHNAVNERTWYEVLKWEEGRGSEVCGGLRLVSFKGKSQELSPRARFKSLLGLVTSFTFHCLTQCLIGIPDMHLRLTDTTGWSIGVVIVFVISSISTLEKVSFQTVPPLFISMCDLLSITGKV